MLKRYPAHKMINLYQEESVQLWDDVEQQIRAEYDASDENEGQIAAQAFAQALGRDGPLDGESE